MIKAQGFAPLVSETVAVEETTGDVPASVLLEAEAAHIASAAPIRRAEFATVRHCARQALARLGKPTGPILPGRGRAPQWPTGTVGSLTHCHGYRAAAVASTQDIVALGIDVESHAPLPDGVASLVTVAMEPLMLETLQQNFPALCWDKLLFSAKESIFKAWFPMMQGWLDFTECQVTIEPETGRFSGQLLVPGPVVNGRSLRRFEGRWSVSDHHICTVVQVHTTPKRRNEYCMAVTREQAIQDVADALFMEPSELDASGDLLDQGMDSVRIMGLVERWRSAGVTHIDYIALAEDQRLEQWLEKLASLQRA